MEYETFLKKVLDASILSWNRTFGGASALSICDEVESSNQEVMAAMEELCNRGDGSMNENVSLYQLNFDTKESKFNFPEKPTVTHVFFPDSKHLENYFYTSHLVRERHPEYKNRLHCGAHQMNMVSFTEEVLARYFDHPEFYEINDSLAGGSIMSTSTCPDERYIYVRHGKRKLVDKGSVVTAFYKDLYSMSDEEQRHWHAYEVKEANFEENDSNFGRFVARALDGAFVTFPDPIQDVSKKLSSINNTAKLFLKTENIHFRMPVENTRKSYYDCCSELYKIIGPDNINQKAVVYILKSDFTVSDSELIHTESNRPLSSIQLLELLEKKMNIEKTLSKEVRKVGKHRTEADHKIISPAVEDINFIELFTQTCNDFISSADIFDYKLRELLKS